MYAIRGSKMNVNVREARSRFKAILDRVAEGQEVILLRHGQEVARLVPPRAGTRRLPSLRDFRASIPRKGKPLSALIVSGREKERY